MRSPAANAELALLLEVAGTPKPGNVDRHRDLAELRFEHFLAGAVGAREGLELAADGAAVGPAFERAVEEMAAQKGGNTQFGALLLLVPLVRAARDDLSQPVAEAVVRETTVGDAASFYRAFDHVDVGVDEPPADMTALDVRRGADAIPALEERGLTLFDIMERSVPGTTSLVSGSGVRPLVRGRRTARRGGRHSLGADRGGLPLTARRAARHPRRDAP